MRPSTLRIKLGFLAEKWNNESQEIRSYHISIQTYIISYSCHMYVSHQFSVALSIQHATRYNWAGRITCGDFFDFEGIVEKRRRWKVFFDELFENDNSHVGIVDAFHAMSNAHDQLPLFTHVVDKVVGFHVAIKT